MQSAITEPQDATYQQLGGGGRGNPPVSQFLLNAPSLSFYPLLLPFVLTFSTLPPPPR